MLTDSTRYATHPRHFSLEILSIPWHCVICQHILIKCLVIFYFYCLTYPMLCFKLIYDRIRTCSDIVKKICRILVTSVSQSSWNMMILIVEYKFGLCRIYNIFPSSSSITMSEQNNKQKFLLSIPIAPLLQTITQCNELKVENMMCLSSDSGTFTKIAGVLLQSRMDREQFWFFHFDLYLMWPLIHRFKNNRFYPLRRQIILKSLVVEIVPEFWPGCCSQINRQKIFQRRWSQ